MAAGRDPYTVCDEADRFSLTSCLHRQSCWASPSGRCAKIAKRVPPSPNSMFNRPCRARRRSLPDCSAKATALDLGRLRRSSASEASDGLASALPSSPELKHKLDLPAPVVREESKRRLPTLSGEIISMILDHVLQVSDLGDNARWSPNRQEAKERWIAAYRERATLHRKFSLIHRSWTPLVLKSLWRHVLLTSRYSIENIQDCLEHPEQLWAWGRPEVVPDRRQLVQFIGFFVGGGRYSSTDYVMYSGKWINTNAMAIFEKLPRFMGWESEGWCSKSCREAPDLFEQMSRTDWPQGRCTRLSFIRSPVHLDALRATLDASPNMETLELIDVGAFLSAEGVLQPMLAKYANKVRFLAVKLDFRPEAPGLLDNVFSACPSLETLHIHHDLMTARFFDQDIPEHLDILLIGTSRGAPLVFRGRAALRSLWTAAHNRWTENVPAQVLDDTPSEVDNPDGSASMDPFEAWLEREVRSGAHSVESLDAQSSMAEASRLCVSAFQ